MIFPLKKKQFLIRGDSGFLPDYKDIAELPVGTHPGLFGYVRKHHIHEGLDFYCEEGDEVYAMLDGEVICIQDFTGIKANSPWWNDTQSVLIRHKDFCLNYGEIQVVKNLKVGDTVVAGQHLGKVVPVLKVNKGRPMSMLHLEMYERTTTSPVSEWTLNNKKPDNLLDPTDFMKTFFNNF